MGSARGEFVIGNVPLVDSTNHILGSGDIIRQRKVNEAADHCGVADRWYEIGPGIPSQSVCRIV